jgi:hypothetical protein
MLSALAAICEGHRGQLLGAAGLGGRASVDLPDRIPAARPEPWFSAAAIWPTSSRERTFASGQVRRQRDQRVPDLPTEAGDHPGDPVAEAEQQHRPSR